MCVCRRLPAFIFRVYLKVKAQRRVSCCTLRHTQLGRRIRHINERQGSSDRTRRQAESQIKVLADVRADEQRS